MSDCKVILTNCSDKFIANQLRKQATKHDPWGPIRGAVIWIALGAVTIAAMDYGDVWLCVGQCNAFVDHGN